mmetsp:Transcript_21430/g.44693  ORF Transcript_21430/g.44693 Transcript_21430/m.44693 type:complete len:208 (+) Transcript_21430:111-734(+)
MQRHGPLPIGHLRDSGPAMTGHPARPGQPHVKIVFGHGPASRLSRRFPQSTKILRRAFQNQRGQTHVALRSGVLPMTAQGSRWGCGGYDGYQRRGDLYSTGQEFVSGGRRQDDNAPIGFKGDAHLTIKLVFELVLLCQGLQSLQRRRFVGGQASFRHGSDIEHEDRPRWQLQGVRSNAPPSFGGKGQGGAQGCVRDGPGLQDGYHVC